MLLRSIKAAAEPHHADHDSDMDTNNDPCGAGGGGSSEDAFVVLLDPGTDPVCNALLLVL